MVSVPDTQFGQRVGAVVMTRVAELDPADVLDHARARLAGYKLRARLVAEPAIPRLDSGKTDLRSVEALLRDDEHEPTEPAPESTP